MTRGTFRLTGAACTHWLGLIELEQYLCYSSVALCMRLFGVTWNLWL